MPMDVKFHFHHKMMELYILKCLGIVKSQRNHILMLQLHHPAYCDLSSARRSPYREVVRLRRDPGILGYPNISGFTI